jgi:hypothetical protein
MDSKGKNVVPMGKAIAIICTVTICCISLIGGGIFLLLNQGNPNRVNAMIGAGGNLFSGLASSRNMEGIFINLDSLEFVEFRERDTLIIHGQVSGTYDLSGSQASARVIHHGTEYFMDFLPVDQKKYSSLLL